MSYLVIVLKDTFYENITMAALSFNYSVYNKWKE